jgi:hypothetical protein
MASAILIAAASLPSLQVLGTILAGGGLACAILWRNRPIAAIGILMFLALSSRPTVEVASVNIRVEQPAMLFLAGYTLFAHRQWIRQLVRRYVLPIAGLAVWLAALAASSILVAPEPVTSLRIVIWLGISFAAAGVAGVLAVRAQRPELVIGAIVLAAVGQVGVALLAAASGRLLGVEWGGFERLGGVSGFRAYGIAWEPNIFASGTALAVPLAMARFMGSGRRADLALVGILGVGVWVALTRTVFVALGVGVLVYVGVLIWQERRMASAWRPRFGAAILALAVGVGSGTLVNLATSSVEPSGLAVRSPGVDSAVLPPPRLGGSPTPSGGPVPSAASPTHAPPELSGAPIIQVDLGDPGTLDHRLVRLRQSFGDLPASPWIGLGANSFSQRHFDPTNSFTADYLGMLPFTVLYDAGFIGLAGYLLFFGGIGLEMLRWRLAPISAAFVAVLAIMAVSYLMTDALRFASNWIVIGAALGMAFQWRSARET